MSKTSAFLTLLAVVWTFSGCGDKIEPGTTSDGITKTVKAQVAVADTGSKPFLYEAVGTVHARTSSTISGKLMGTVKAIHVRAGDSVKKGDVLIEIDGRQATAQLRKAEASLAEARRAMVSTQSARTAAKAASRLSKKTYGRYKLLLEEESVSRQEFEEVETKYRQAKASLSQADSMVEAAKYRIQQAQASLESAQISKKDTRVTAPYNGTVTAKMIDEGGLASPGTPFLTLEKDGVFCVSLVVPEKHIQSVSLGQKVNITIPSMQDMAVQGTVGSIDPAADLKSRSFTVKVALPDEEKFRTGIFARVAIPVGEAGMIVIPEKAVVERGQLQGFYLVDENDIAHFRLLRTGRLLGDSVEVLSGLQNNDRYVTNPSLDIQNGVKVEASK